MIKSKTEWHPRESKEQWLQMRTQDITSTDVSALFGMSPYITAFELWHKKKAAVIDSIEPNEAMKWGLRLEEAIAKGIAEDQGWKIRRINRYGRLPEFRLGASFDYQILNGDTRILEIKNVNQFRHMEAWIDTESKEEAPPHIELQLQQEMFVAQTPKAGYIGALIGGSEKRLIKRDPSEKIQRAIIEKTAAFWKSIEENEPPEPDYAADHDYLKELHLQSIAGKQEHMESNSHLRELCRRYDAARAEEKECSTRKREASAEILTIIDDAEKVFADGFTISAKTQPEREVPASVRKATRPIRITKKKEKK
jgi:putative phage-type endonuclease